MHSLMRLTTKFQLITLLTGLTIFVTLDRLFAAFYNAAYKYTSRVQYDGDSHDTHRDHDTSR